MFFCLIKFVYGGICYLKIFDVEVVVDIVGECVVV